jgi:hypothetical protein
MQHVQNITQAYSQAPWRKQVQWIGTFLLALVFAWLIAALYLDVTARAATIGREIQEMQIGQLETVSSNPEANPQLSIEELKRHNADLQSQLAYLLSEEVMERRASELGFEPLEPGNALYIEVPGYVPRQTAVLALPPGPTIPSIEAPAPIIKSSLADWLKDQIRQAEKLLK